MADHFPDATKKVDFISRDEAIDNLCENCFLRNCSHDCDAVKAIRRTKPADVRPVKIGHYVTDDMGDFSCSECGEKYLDITKRFCPECGAELRRNEK